LLIPKVIVRRHLDYDAGEYFRYYLLEHLRQLELDANSALVELLKNRKRRVTKKSLIEKYGEGKAVIVRETLRHPEILTKYRRDKRRIPHLPLSHEDIANIEAQAPPNWDRLLEDVLTLQPGDKDASAYETAVEGLLTALFYPMLTNPIFQHEIHGGRKRIDITYTNMATAGFFSWLATHFPAAQVFVECKNYGREVGNPELDQLSGRFSPSRGKFGLLVCRSFRNRQLFDKRCKDTASDDRGFIIALDDVDLRSLVESRKTDSLFAKAELLRKRFQTLLN
jgi:hypothetical protein